MWYAALIGGILEAMGSLIGRALISAGVGVVSYKLLDTSIAWAESKFFTAAGGLPSATVQVLGVMEVDTSVTMICSAILLRLTFKGLSAGVMKSFKVS